MRHTQFAKVLKIVVRFWEPTRWAFGAQPTAYRYYRSRRAGRRRSNRCADSKKRREPLELGQNGRRSLSSRSPLFTTSIRPSTICFAQYVGRALLLQLLQKLYCSVGLSRAWVRAKNGPPGLFNISPCGLICCCNVLRVQTAKWFSHTAI